MHAEHDLLGVPAIPPSDDGDHATGCGGSRRAVALVFNVSDIAAGIETVREELNAFLERMHANAVRTRELAERGQAKLDAERSDR